MIGIESSKSGKFVRVAGSAALVLVAFLPGYIATQRDPAGGPDDADLQVRSESVSPPEDGLYPLLAAVRQIRLSDEDARLISRFRAGDDIKTAEVARILDANSRSFTALHRALEAPSFLLPKTSNDAFEFAPEIPVETGQLVDLFGARSLYDAQRGAWNLAFERALDILRLAHRLEGAGRGVLATTMLSVEYRAEGLETLRRLATMAPLHNAQARRWVEALPGYRSDPAAWKRMWAVEYQHWKSFVGWMADRAAEKSRLDHAPASNFQGRRMDLRALRRETTRTLEIFADMTRAYQRASENNCVALGELPFPAATRSNNDTGGAFEITLEIAPPDYRDFFLRRCAEDTALAATQTLIALRAYEQDSGSLPERLIDLVPDYLATIPTDTFRGEPLRYSKARKLVYSIGTSGMEAPGQTSNDAYDAFRVLRYPIEF